MRVSRHGSTLVLALALAAWLVPVGALAFDPFLVIPSADVVETASAYRYSNLDGHEALEQLRRRGVLFQELEPVRGVRNPIRLTGRLRGVHVHGSMSEVDRTTSPFEICDARLALALDDFAAVLARHNIDEVVHYTMYRPSALRPTRRVAPPASLPDSSTINTPLAQSGAAQEARSSSVHAATAKVTHAKRGSSPRGTPTRSNTARGPSRHASGLAIDVASFHKNSGEWLSVAADFGGRIGARTCGGNPNAASDTPAQELRAIVCEAFDAKVFTNVLTPNYDRAHRDHFHMELHPGVKWFLYH